MVTKNPDMQKELNELDKAMYSDFLTTWFPTSWRLGAFPWKSTLLYL